MGLDARLAGLLVAALCTAIVVGRASTAPAPKPRREATAEERRGFAAQVASQEDGWRQSAAEDFPADVWSQRDAFHGHEARSVMDLASGAGVSYEDVLRAIDEDLHRVRLGAKAPARRGASAVPCQPRPIFD